MSEAIYGINPVREALRSRRRRPLELFLARHGRSERTAELEREAEALGLPIRRRDPADLARLAGSEHHQGAVLRIEPFAYATLDELIEEWRQAGWPAFFLMLDGITDPHNLGAILRSADAAGCRGVIVAKDRSCPVTAVVDKTSAGALEHIPLCRVTNLARTLDRLKEEGIWVFGLADAAEQSLHGTDFTGDLILVVGSEGGGLRPNVARRCDHLVKIPMAGGVSSLNASVAAALALFEVVRQRPAR